MPDVAPAARIDTLREPLANRGAAFTDIERERCASPIGLRRGQRAPVARVELEVIDDVAEPVRAVEPR